jgi:hypothetical protein
MDKYRLLVGITLMCSKMQAKKGGCELEIGLYGPEIEVETGGANIV